MVDNDYYQPQFDDYVNETDTYTYHQLHLLLVRKVMSNTAVTLPLSSSALSSIVYY